MKTFENIMLVVSLVFLVMLFGLKINFKPFRITFEDWRYGLGWVLLIIGVTIVIYDRSNKRYHEGFGKGLKEGSQMVIDQLNKAVDEINEKKKEGTL